MKIIRVFFTVFLLVICVSLKAQTVTNQTRFSQADLAYLKSNGIDPNTVTIVTPLTNKVGTVISPEDFHELKSQGYTEEEMANLKPIPPQQHALPPTPPDLKNALIYVDSFLGSGETGFPADVISFKKGMLKFRSGEKDFDYSGNFSILLTTPRKHRNPYLGLGAPEVVKLLILEDFFKGIADGAAPLQNATIWEKSDGYIVAEAAGKEWIHSGTYTIQN